MTPLDNKLYRREHTIGVVLFALLTLAMPLALVAPLLSQSNINLSDPLILPALAVLVFSAYRLTISCGTGERYLMSLTFWIFNYIFLGLTPSLCIVARAFRGQRELSDASIWTAYAAIGTAFIAYEAVQPGVDIVQHSLPLRVPVLLATKCRFFESVSSIFHISLR